MAKAYGRYAALSQKVQRIDSLLWLSSLSAVAQDSVLAQIRQSRRGVAEQQGERKGLIFVNRTDSGEEMARESPPQSEVDGFLNYRNDRQVARARAAFISVWGERPLRDNWRRIEAVGEDTQPGERRKPA